MLKSAAFCLYGVLVTYSNIKRKCDLQTCIFFSNDGYAILHIIGCFAYYSDLSNFSAKIQEMIIISRLRLLHIAPPHSTHTLLSQALTLSFSKTNNPFYISGLLWLELTWNYFLIRCYLCICMFLTWAIKRLFVTLAFFTLTADCLWLFFWDQCLYDLHAISHSACNILSHIPFAQGMEWDVWVPWK